MPNRFVSTIVKHPVQYFIFLEHTETLLFRAGCRILHFTEACLTHIATSYNEYRVLFTESRAFFEGNQGASSKFPTAWDNRRIVSWRRRGLSLGPSSLRLCWQGDSSHIWLLLINIRSVLESHSKNLAACIGCLSSFVMSTVGNTNARLCCMSVKKRIVGLSCSDAPR